MRHGWPWLNYLKDGQVLSQEEVVASGNHDDDPAWGEVRIDYVTPDASERGAYVARVEQTSSVECIYSTAETARYAYPQYTVTRLERIA